MYSGIKERLLNNKKLLSGKETREETKQMLEWATMAHKSIHDFACNYNGVLPIAVLNALEDRMIELSQARTKLQNNL